MKKTADIEEEAEEQDDLSDYKASKNQAKNDESEQTDEDQRSDINETSMDGSRPALPAEPGTLKATLLETPSEYCSIFSLLCYFYSRIFFKTLDK